MDDLGDAVGNLGNNRSHTGTSVGRGFESIDRTTGDINRSHQNAPPTQQWTPGPISLYNKISQGRWEDIEVDPIATLAGLGGSAILGPGGGVLASMLGDYLSSADISVGDIFAAGTDGTTINTDLYSDRSSQEGYSNRVRDAVNQFGTTEELVKAVEDRANEIFGLARDSAFDYLGQRGLNADNVGIDYDPLTSLITQGLEGRRGELSMANYGDLAQQIASNAIGTQTNIARDRFGLETDNLFPTGFATERLPDTMDDALIESIIGDRFGDATSFLDRGVARGQLSDKGYQQALANLTDQRSAANSRVQDLGLGLIEQGRGDLRTIADSARTDASSFELGRQFDLDSFGRRADERVSSFTDGLEGSLRNAIGGDPIFDTQAAFGAGAVGQGFVNPTGGATDLAAAIRDRNRRQTGPRGIGNQGSF